MMVNLKIRALVSDNYLGRQTTTILAGLPPETGRVRKRGLQLSHSAWS
jgi:hypothetical protein